VVLLGQAAAWVHSAATPHVTCLEHGDSVHLAVAHTTGPAASVANVHRLAVTSPTEGAEAHGHEHCSLRAQRVATPDAPSVASAAALLTPDVVPPIVVATASSHLILLAPKTSPPPAPVA
jgi:hypothetical protein